jgi:hypothetical protein
MAYLAMMSLAARAAPGCRGKVWQLWLTGPGTGRPVRPRLAARYVEPNADWVLGVVQGGA